MDYSTIKLIIWDLDETFWSGTLSEEGIKIIGDNIALIKLLNSRGIVNSICSKNELKQTEDTLVKLGISNEFVFKSINWLPKGDRCKSIVDNMGLRYCNVLFIDDNLSNLNEVNFHCPGIMVAEPYVITELYDYFIEKPESDPKRTRLSQYKILENKQTAKIAYGDNEAFLYSSNIKVQVEFDCVNEISRLSDLVIRSNQLNFTKNRMNENTLLEFINSDDYKAGYVKVKDDFGDYGIVGFFLFSGVEGVHFVFSCRTIGLGIEQYIYHHLSVPSFDVLGTVVSNLVDSKIPGWINQNEIKNKQSENCIKSSVDNNGLKILIKTACDFGGILRYLDKYEDYIDTEFSYVDVETNYFVEHHNHSTNIINLMNDD